jgi:hypothetical protein
MKYSFTQLGFALILLVIAILGYTSWLFTVQAASTKASLLASQIDGQSENATRDTEAANTLASLAKESAQIQNTFIGTQDIVPFLEALQTKGASLGTTVSVGSVSAMPTPRPHLQLSLTIKGTFDAVMRTVGTIEYAPYDIEVTSFALNDDATTNTTATSSWTANANISVGMKDPSMDTPSLPATTAPSTASTTATTTLQNDITL